MLATVTNLAIATAQAVGLMAKPDPRAPVPRSPKWPGVRAAYLKQFPVCAACGGKEKLEVHHVTPFHLDPTRELDPGNLITLCDPHHLLVGHLMSWASFNAEVRADAAIWFRKIRSRPGSKPVAPEGLP